MRNRPLQVKVEDDELVIRIGIGTLAFAAERCPLLTEYPGPGEKDPPYCKIADAKTLADDIARELLAEEEDGSTPLDYLLDNAILKAYEDGAEGFHIDY